MLRKYSLKRRPTATPPGAAPLLGQTRPPKLSGQPPTVRDSRHFLKQKRRCGWKPNTRREPVSKPRTETGKNRHSCEAHVVCGERAPKGNSGTRSERRLLRKRSRGTARDGFQRPVRTPLEAARGGFETRSCRAHAKPKAAARRVISHGVWITGQSRGWQGARWAREPAG